MLEVAAMVQPQLGVVTILVLMEATANDLTHGSYDIVIGRGNDFGIPNIIILSGNFVVLILALFVAVLLLRR